MTPILLYTHPGDSITKVLLSEGFCGSERMIKILVMLHL